MPEYARIANCRPGPVDQNCVGVNFGEVPFAAKRLRNRLQDLSGAVQITQPSKPARGNDRHGRRRGKQRYAAIRVIAAARIVERFEPRLNLGARDGVLLLALRLDGRALVAVFPISWQRSTNSGL